MTHWDKPITFLGSHIHGELRDRGVQIKAILTIPKEKERQIRRELLRVASYHHIPERDAMMSMNATIRGWSNYDKYANSPQVVLNRVAHTMWWFYAHFLAQKHRMSIKTLMTWAKSAGRHKMVKKEDRQVKTFMCPVGKKEYHRNVFPPKTAVLTAKTNKVEWTVDLKPVNPASWIQGRSAATRLSALARSEGIGERCGKNSAEQVHHKNRMKTKRTMLAKVMSDKDQREQALALCKECHLEVHQGRFNG